VWGVADLTPDWEEANTTIYAINTSTHQVAWSYFLPTVPYRGWLTASNGLVYAGSLDGSVHVLNAMTGKQVYELYIGTPLYDSPTIGAGADGQVYLYQLIGEPSYGAFSGGVPGDIMAFTLPPSSTPPWEILVPVAIVGVLAAVATVLFIENRSLRRSRRRN